MKRYAHISTELRSFLKILAGNYQNFHHQLFAFCMYMVHTKHMCRTLLIYEAANIPSTNQIVTLHTYFLIDRCIMATR